MSAPTDLALRLGRLLGVGSRASTVVLAAGLVAYLVDPAGAPAMWLLDTGLIVLMATPAARVAVAAVTYARDGEWMFAAMAAAVLGVLFVGAVFATG
ncbi:MAG: DUF1634 domain-containing protein [Acidobacteriota bacterium]